MLRASHSAVDRLSRPLLVLAAHPDDETIGLGGQLPCMSPNVVIVHLTAGAPRTGDPASEEAYARTRREELLTALRLAGIPEQHCMQLGAVDQESCFNLRGWTARFLELLKDIQPRAIYCHPYEGGHPDHDSAAFIAHTALTQLKNPPPLFEFTSYHAGSSGMETGCFLQNGPAVTEFYLSQEQRELKRRMFHCMVSQCEVLHQFRIDVERIREAPRYDFTEPPHEGTLYYERFNWGVKGAEWRRLASEALSHA